MREVTTQLEIRLGFELHEITDPSMLWTMDIGFVSRGAITLDDMEKLSLDQYLGILRTLEKARR